MDVRIEKDDLNWAAAQGVIDKAQAEQLWDALSERTADQPRFGLVHVLYSFGALVVIGAMGWSMNNAWEVLGGAGIFAISIIYSAVFVGLDTDGGTGPVSGCQAVFWLRWAYA